jgi:hypothetical protein
LNIIKFSVNVNSNSHKNNFFSAPGQIKRLRVRTWEKNSSVAEDFSGDHEDDPFADICHPVGDAFQVVTHPDQVDAPQPEF